MLNSVFIARLRTAFAITGLAGLLALAGCGGGSGAPNNPYVPPPPAPAPLTLLPGAITIYSGTPASLTISGGVAPYRVFSADPAVLPVPATTSGSVLALSAKNVGIITPVTVTVQDALGTVSLPATVNVNPAPLSPSAITITANPNPACSSTTNTICSGGSGTAVITVTGAGGGGIPNRQVKFDVVQGAFSILTTNPAQPQASTLTVITDNAGNAVVSLFVAADTPTQVGILRATDVTSGNQTTANFTVLQVTTGGEVLSVLPQGLTTVSGPTTGVCSTGVTVTNYIFGGTPPYQVATNFPGAVSLVGVPVQKSGNGFDTITNGTCFVNLTYVITDATGRTIPGGAYPTVTNEPGTTPAPPPPPGPLVATPGAIGKNNCTPANTFQFVVTGGVAPYSVVTGGTDSQTSVILSPQTGLAAGQAVTVSGITSPATTVINVFDSQVPPASTTVNIACAGSGAPPTPANLAVAPNNFSYLLTSCVNATSNFVITGGNPPYNAFFSSPRPGGVISPPVIGISGGGFSVTGLTDGVALTNITVVDSSSPALLSVVTVNCPTVSPIPPTPPLATSPTTYGYSSSSCVGQTSNFVVTGGTPPYNVAFSTPRPGAVITPPVVGASGSGFAITGLTDGVGQTNITISDSANPPVLNLATIFCPLTAIPPSVTALVISPSSYGFLQSTCVGRTSNFVITGGKAPYSVFFSTPRPGGVITPAVVAAAGLGFAVTGLTDSLVLTTNITVQDASTPPLLQIATIDCPPP